DRAYTPIAQTEPAYRSLLTARWPTATGVRYPLTAEERWAGLPTFPAALTAAGWRTSFQTDCSRFNWQGESSGFTERRQPPRGALNFALEKLRYRALGVLADNAAGAALLPELIDNRALAGVYDPVGYGKRLMKNLAADAASGPSLFVFHSTAAHFPGDPVYPHYRRFVSPSAPLERRLRMIFSPIGGGKDAAAAGWGRVESEALYDELLGQADAQLGQVLDGLRERGLYDEATIIVLSDHGESFHADVPAISGATPVHGARLSDEENRMLLAVKLPRSQGAKRVEQVDALVRLVDIGPTILALAGLPPLAAADGVSLLPLLHGESAPPQRLYAETGFTHASPEVFDPGHAATAPRTFDAYRVRPDGVVELSPAAHEAVMREKDYGAFDGRSWLVRAPQKDGTVAERCTGPCDDPGLKSFLEETLR
ncbi:MAG: sulfatase-like hydrolase/transferase, partial [Myxococcaceae bacterium]